MPRRTSTLAERIASIERDVANAAKAHGDKGLADSARGLRNIVRVLDLSAVAIRRVAHDQDFQEATLDALAAQLSGARAGTV